jgi:hypothetical protein
MKPLDELTRVTENKIGAGWIYATNVADMEAILKPGYFSATFPDRQMRSADKVEVYIFDGEKLSGVADLVVSEVNGKQVTVAKREDVAL